MLGLKLGLGCLGSQPMTREIFFEGSLNESYFLLFSDPACGRELFF